MDDAIYTEELENEVELRIEQGEALESPRDWGNVSTIALFHNRYTLPNESDYNKDDFNSWDELENQIIKDNPGAVILTVSMFDHSGVSVYVGGPRCAWDSGRIGFIFCPADIIRAEYKVKRISKQLRAKVETILEHEVEAYNKYLNNDVYDWVLLDKRTDAAIDACGGYYDKDDAIAAAKENVPSVEKLQELRRDYAEGLIARAQAIAS